jgi:hypothetical protein
VRAARRKVLGQAPPMFAVQPPPTHVDLTSDFFDRKNNKDQPLINTQKIV